MSPGAQRRRGEPTPLAETLDAVRRELGLGDPGQFETIRSGWSEAVGSALAERSRALDLRDGVLRIRADDAVAATELRYRATEIQAWAERVAPGCGVAKVRVSLARTDRPGTT